MEESYEFILKTFKKKTAVIELLWNIITAHNPT